MATIFSAALGREGSMVFRGGENIEILLRLVGKGIVNIFRSGNTRRSLVVFLIFCSVSFIIGLLPFTMILVLFKLPGFSIRTGGIFV